MWGWGECCTCLHGNIQKSGCVALQMVGTESVKQKYYDDKTTKMGSLIFMGNSQDMPWTNNLPLIIGYITNKS